MVLIVEARVWVVFARPNRRYKVPKAVLAERLEIGWLHVFRVRAAILALKGYDPHVENWDHSPFHHNETGSHNQKTLAVAGVEVPLVELHTATRMRWTANLTTFSDHARRKERGPPTRSTCSRRTARSSCSDYSNTSADADTSRGLAWPRLRKARAAKKTS